jgi:uncharacterized protein (TIGR02646 family)
MKFIPKTPEPPEFTAWKQFITPDWQPNWEDFRKPEKPIVHQALIDEQGHICCYCGQRITQTNSHIEHFKPRTHFPELKLSYENFLASCPGYPEKETPTPNQTQPKQEFCGQYKGDWYDANFTVSPLQEDCASYFRYEINGNILPTQDASKTAAATATIDKLGLNHKKLILQREEAIAGIIQGLETLTDAEIHQLIEAYNQPDSSGKLTRFCAAVIYTLQSFLP